MQNDMNDEGGVSFRVFRRHCIYWPWCLLFRYNSLIPFCVHIWFAWVTTTKHLSFAWNREAREKKTVWQKIAAGSKNDFGLKIIYYETATTTIIKRTRSAFLLCWLLAVGSVIHLHCKPLQIRVSKENLLICHKSIKSSKMTASERVGGSSSTSKMGFGFMGNNNTNGVRTYSINKICCKNKNNNKNACSNGSGMRRRKMGPCIWLLGFDAVRDHSTDYDNFCELFIFKGRPACGCGPECKRTRHCHFFYWAL